MKNKLILLSLVFVFILTSGFGCKGESKEIAKAMKPVTLKYWRVWDGPDAFSEIIAAYKQQHPYVNIEYHKLRYSEFEQTLLEALAEDEAPDIISLHNTWIKKYQSKIVPMPAQTSMAFPVLKGTLKKEVVNEIRTVPGLSEKDIKKLFVDQVYDDVVVGGEVLALPLSVDSLAMFYNKDLFNNAGIIDPPEYWNKEFQENVRNLTKLNTNGYIIQSGVALGGSDNIERSTDILSVLMMQNGATMMESGSVKFAAIPAAYVDQKFNPGMEALRFFTDFASPTKEVYSWSHNLDNSLDTFAKGKLAIMFGYAYHIPTIKAKGPKLKFGIAPLPQIEGNIKKDNYANYWVETVMKKSKNPAVAWNFIQFATKENNAKLYLDKTKKPTALRSLIEAQLEDEEIGIFADQLLTAKSWYQGKDANAMEDHMKEMINETLANPSNILEAMNTAAGKIQQTIN